MINQGDVKTKRRPHHPGLSGFWSYDVKHDKVFGDADHTEFFGRSQKEIEEGAPLERSLSRIREDDLPRVDAALRRSIEFGAEFREEFFVTAPNMGQRKILSVGRSYLDTFGETAKISGWFVDITDRDLSKFTALRMAAHHVEEASSAVQAAEHDFITYMLDNVLEEIDTVLNNDGNLL